MPSVVDSHGRRQVVFGVVDPSCAADENIRRGLVALKARLQRRAGSILAFVGLAVIAVLYSLLRDSSSWWLILMIVLVATGFVAAAIRWIIVGGRTRTRAGFVRLGPCPACANGVSDDGAGQFGCDACGACWQPPN